VGDKLNEVDFKGKIDKVTLGAKEFGVNFLKTHTPQKI
jgi:hypothetical protein